MKLFRHVLRSTAAALLLISYAVGSTAFADAAYPTRPIKLVVPYPAGGASDAVARMVGGKLQQAWGQPVMSDNRPGAAGMIGTQAVTRAPADGYTVLVHNTVLIQQPAVMEKLPYDPFSDLLPVVLTLRTNNLFVVPGDSPAKTLKEFIGLAKANPKQHNYGSYGIASAAHLHGELFRQQAGVDLAHIPFQGSAPIVTSLAGGQLSSAFIDIPTALPHIKSMRALAVAGSQRIPELPDVPTFTELGYRSFEPSGWHGMFMPAGTPPAVAQKFAQGVSSALRMPDVAAKLRALGVSPGGGTPDEFVRQIKDDAPVYAEIARTANIRITP